MGQLMANTNKTLLVVKKVWPKVRKCPFPTDTDAATDIKMDDSELRMNLAALQRIDPYIKGIIDSSSQVSSRFYTFKVAHVMGAS